MRAAMSWDVPSVIENSPHVVTVVSPPVQKSLAGDERVVAAVVLAVVVDADVNARWENRTPWGAATRSGTTARVQWLRARGATASSDVTQARSPTPVRVRAGQHNGGRGGLRPTGEP